jgi:hypothetical protein
MTLGRQVSPDLAYPQKKKQDMAAEPGTLAISIDQLRFLNAAESGNGFSWQMTSVDLAAAGRCFGL